MKNNVLNLIVGVLFGAQVIQAWATGLVTIPVSGFSNSAYTLCNTSGNFGSVNSVAPSSTIQNTCAVFPGSELVSPVAGYTPIASTSRSAVINGISIGTVTDRIYRNSSQTSCIFGTKFTANSNDWDPNTPGNQYFEVNDIARGGFSGLSVNAGYFAQAVNSFPVYRIGRTFTSVQHRSYNVTGSVAAAPGINYLALPVIPATSTTAINGETTLTFPASTTSAKQSAEVNGNWVDFTLQSYYVDPYGLSMSPVSSVVYVEAACDSSSPISWVKSRAIRLRQTGQEGQPLLEVLVDGYAPPGATVP